jgi:UDP-N-acetylmuramate--alanine ligase
MRDVAHHAGGVSFTLTGPGTSVAVSLPKPGTHLATNAAGVLTLLALEGFDVHEAARSLEAFSGVRRRYEVRAVVNDITIVDDYAHHPTEVAATITAASLSATGRVIAVFQPHRYTRTANLGPEFGAPLALADEVFVTDVYAAGEEPIIGVSGRLVAEAAGAEGARVTYVPRLSEIPDLVATTASEGDVVLLLGAGDITSIAGPVAQAIARPS